MTAVLTIENVLALPVVRRGLPQVLAGESRLGRHVRWAHVLDMSEVDGLLKGGELILSAGGGLADSGRKQRDFVLQLEKDGAAGLGIELGSVFQRSLPHAIVDTAEAAGLPLFAFHRRVRFVEITEAVHGELLDAQFALLQRADELHHQFARTLLDGGGVPGVMEALARITGNPVVLENAGHQLLHYATHQSDDDTVLAAWEDLARQRAQHADTNGSSAVASEIEVKGRSGGRLLVLRLDSELHELDRVAIEQATVAITLEMQRSSSEELLRSHARREFLSGLAGDRLDERTARRRAIALGFPSDHGTLLPMALAWRHAGISPELARMDWAPLIEPIRQQLKALGLSALIEIGKDELMVVANLGRRRADAAFFDEIAASIRSGDRELSTDAIVLAIGVPQLRWIEAGRSLATALRAAGGARAAAPRAWYDASRTTVTDLLYAIREAPELAHFVDDQIGALLDHDREQQRALTMTLEALIRHGGRKAETARSLHLGRQSLYLRLERIEKILGVDLDDPDDLLALALALRTHQVLDALSSNAMQRPAGGEAVGRPAPPSVERRGGDAGGH
jgi:purine catabolism regulator